MLRLAGAGSSSPGARLTAALRGVPGIGAEPLEIGQRIGRIRIVKLLGRGGMGEVYAGVDEQLRRPVAIKTIRPDRFLSPDAKARFLREARVLSRLDHPNICRLYDYVESESVELLLLEHIEGRSLAELLIEGKMDRSAWMSLALQLARALIAAHAQGVVHRDLKPGNIMVTPEGRLKVLDFGLARPAGHSVDESAQGEDQPQFGDEDVGRTLAYFTRAGSIMGTPRYMSPEQARGDPVGPAADIYAFGLVLQEMITGEPARVLDGRSSLGLARRVVEAQRRPLEGVRRDVRRLIDAMTREDPTERPAAPEVLHWLEAIRDRPHRRLRRLAVLALVLVGLAGIARYTVDVERARDRAESLAAFTLGDLYETLRPTGKLEPVQELARRSLEAISDRRSWAGTSGLLAARAHLVLADIALEEGEFLLARNHAQVAVQRYRALLDSSPGDAARFLLARALLMSGSIESTATMAAQAPEDTREALAMFDDLVPLAGNRPERLRILIDLLRTRARWADFDRHPDEALEAIGEAYRYAHALVQQTGTLTDRHLLATLRVERAVFLTVTGRISEGVEEHAAALHTLRDLIRRAPQNVTWRVDLRSTLHEWAITLLDVSRPAEALEAIQEAIAVSRDLLAIEEDNLSWRDDHVGLLHSGAGIVEQLGRQADAGPLLREAVQLSLESLERRPSSRHIRFSAVGALTDLGGWLRRRGSFEESLDVLRQAQTLIDQAGPELGPLASDTIADTMAATGWTLIKLGRREEARIEYKRAKEALQTALQGAAPNLLGKQALAMIALGLGDTDRARDLTAELRAEGGPVGPIEELARDLDVEL